MLKKKTLENISFYVSQQIHVCYGFKQDLSAFLVNKQMMLDLCRNKL